jgi:hypothetical protein
MRDQLKKNKKALVIVAHPDDETIWMGGTMMRHKDIRWTIFSLCRSSDTDRAPKFKKVCEHYGANCLMDDLDDTDTLEFHEAVVESIELIKKNIKSKKYNYIFTHGRNGEYGHGRHVAVNHAVDKLIQEGFLAPEKIFYFDYQKKDKTLDYSEIILGDEPDYVVELSDEEYQAKRGVMSGIYGFDPDGPDINYCTNPEGFTAKIL